MRLTAPFLALLIGLAAPLASAQDSAFSPVVLVNDSAVTAYEFDQRVKFLTVLGTQGDIEAEARKGLIEDRIRVSTAKSLGIKVTDEEIQAGMAEFAGRANLDVPKFLEAIAPAGVEPETFRDFVRAGLLWRGVIRARFAGHVPYSEAEVDRALSADYGRGAGMQVLLSEIYIPAKPGNVGKAMAEAQDILDTAHSEAGFAEAARLHSAAASRLNGGRVDWIPVSNLPPQVAQALSALGQGQISEPVRLPGYVGLFMLRGQQQGSEKLSPAAVVVDYAEVVLPAATADAEAARLQANADTCDDLYTLEKGLPADQLKRAKARRGQIGGAIGQALDGLDANEGTLVRQGNATSYVMLCSRTAVLADSSINPAAPPIDPTTGTTKTAEGAPPIDKDLGLGLGPARDLVRDEVVNRKVVQLADAYMAELVAEAIIRTP